MIIIKSKAEIELMKVAGRITGETLKRVEEAVKPGVTTRELDKIAEDYIRSQGCLPSFKGYGGFLISDKHKNFIEINKDLDKLNLVKLIERIQEVLYNKVGLFLETEIIIVY